MKRTGLLRLGFDLTTGGRREGMTMRVRCSQCEALVINGEACHETGCPNAVHECHGCYDLVPMRVKYCENCQ
jgi:hypothetical protein